MEFQDHGTAQYPEQLSRQICKHDLFDRARVEGQIGSRLDQCLDALMQAITPLADERLDHVQKRYNFLTTPWLWER
jgi:hypothetical protein